MPWLVRAGFFFFFSYQAFHFVDLIRRSGTEYIPSVLFLLTVYVTLLGVFGVFKARLGRTDDIEYIAQQLEEALLPAT